VVPGERQGARLASGGVCLDPGSRSIVVWGIIMSMRWPRRKRRHLWLSIAYRLLTLPFASPDLKLRMFLNAEWLFWRLSHQFTYRVYTKGDNPIKQRQWEFLRRHLPKGASVLDLGCGDGHLSDLISQEVGTVVGVDHDEAAIRGARTAFIRDNLSFHSGDVHAFLAERADPFDVLILAHVLEHIDEPEAFMRRLSGQFRFAFVEVPDFEATHLNVYRKKLGLDLAYTDADHISEFGRHELRSILADADLEVIDSEHVHGVQRLWCKATST